MGKDLLDRLREAYDNEISNQAIDHFFNFDNVLAEVFTEEKDVICWWSGGVTSAVACKIAIDFYGKHRCRVIMLDTHNEHDDTYRFLQDCQKWYGIEIESITAIGNKYEDIKAVWYKYNSLNVAHGAICSSELKRKVREDWEKYNTFTHQVFGFEFTAKEFKRATGMALNNPQVKAIFPLLMLGYDKPTCIKIVEEAGIAIPMPYRLGLHNNNCIKTGCVQGGIGYWKKIKEEMPEKFEQMAKIEHELTDRKGKPVTMLKDQSKKAKESGDTLVFLKKHPKYPRLKCLDDMKGRKVEPLVECNGFCGANDLIDVPTEKEINYQN